jgi:hypothetical protein
MLLFNALGVKIYNYVLSEFEGMGLREALWTAVAVATAFRPPFIR